MLIDWFTVGAQLVNFLLLVWLLKRFLYKPVMQAIDTRERRISAELADADAKRKDALEKRGEFQAKNQAFDEQRAALIKKAVADAKAEQVRLMAQIRAEADALRSKQDAALRREQTELGASITRLASAEVFEIVRKTLSDLASVSLEERMGEIFTRRLREMDAKAKDEMTKALHNSSEHTLVRSMFEIGSVQKAAIQNALNETFSCRVQVSFETSPAGICGIELTIGGLRTSWNISDYLSLLEKKISELVDRQGRAEGVIRWVDPLPAAVLSVA
jgi:F-type H+-transporting ATPase subunit b